MTRGYDFHPEAQGELFAEIGHADRGWPAASDETGASRLMSTSKEAGNGISLASSGVTQ